VARDDHLDAGHFNKPIQFQTRTLIPDPSGGYTAGTWTTVYKCFAHIDNFASHGRGSGGIRRPFQFMQLYPEMESLVSIRYQASIALTIDMIILYRSRRYQILGIHNPHEEQVTILIPVILYQAPGMPG
jgi:head-tail adaptor